MVLWIPFVESINFYICILKNMYISRNLWRQKVKWPQPLFFLVENFMPIPSIYSYIRLRFCFWEVCCFFCITTLCLLKIWYAFGSFMKSNSSQTGNSMKTKFCSLPNDGVQHLKSGRQFMLIPNIHSYIGFSVAVKTLLNFIKSLYKILQTDSFFFGFKIVNEFRSISRPWKVLSSAKLYISFNSDKKNKSMLKTHSKAWDNFWHLKVL